LGEHLAGQADAGDPFDAGKWLSFMIFKQFLYKWNEQQSNGGSMGQRWNYTST